MNLFRRIFQPVGFNHEAYLAASDTGISIEERCRNLALIGSQVAGGGGRGTYYFENWIRTKLIPKLGWGDEGMIMYDLYAGAIIHRSVAAMEVDHMGKKTLLIDPKDLGRNSYQRDMKIIIESKSDGTKTYWLSRVVER